jgi:hypothetical protein
LAEALGRNQGPTRLDSCDIDYFVLAKHQGLKVLTLDDMFLMKISAVRLPSFQAGPRDRAVRLSTYGCGNKCFGREVLGRNQGPTKLHYCKLDYSHSREWFRVAKVV